MTGVIAKYMREHTMENEIWDEGQLGACSQLVEKWKTRLEIWSRGENLTSRWIDISCGFFQGDSYSPVGFCISEIPVCLLLQQSKGYRMGPPGCRDISRTLSLFVDDLKQYQENHETLQDVNEVIVQASNDTGACYGVTKCAEIVFEHGKLVRGEGLQVLEERMESMDPDENEIYKFLGIEQDDGIETKRVYERVKHEVTKRVRMLINTELDDINLVRAINAKVIPVAAYPMNVCKFSNRELKELDQVIKREMRSSNILGKQGSDERLYLKREDGGRGIKSMRDVYQETRLRVACYMACSTNSWIQATWRREMMKEKNAIVTEAVKIMEDVGVRIQFEKGSISIDREVIEGGWKLAWRRLKEKRKKGVKARRIESYQAKEQQSKVYSEQEKECHMWLTQNLNPRKTAAIMMMLEQIVETRSWKQTRGLMEDGRCRVCFQHSETVKHLVAGCQNLANSEYVSRHNRALMILTVAWAKEHGLIAQDVVWYEQRWDRGTVFENERAKLMWDFEFHLRKTTTSRRSDLILETKEDRKILICDMACPQQQNIDTKRMEKLMKYRQLAFETRERCPGYVIKVVPVIIDALGGGTKMLKTELKTVFNDQELVHKIAGGMQRMVLMDSESIVRRGISGLIQGDEADVK